MSLVGKFEIRTFNYFVDSALDAVKTFVNNTQLRVKYSLETKEYRFSGITKQYVMRRCVLHETDSYALVIKMAYDVETDMSSINASDLDQPPCNQIGSIAFCVKPL
uniref:Uncharacterized protein n=1 Tax=Acrobeloides nanus TaxID=290746 RepID=A0A914DG13_9BILA